MFFFFYSLDSHSYGVTLSYGLNKEETWSFCFCVLTVLNENDGHKGGLVGKKKSVNKPISRRSSA